MSRASHKHIRENVSATLESIADRQFLKLLADPPDPILTSRELEVRVRRVMDRIESEERRAATDSSAELREREGERRVRATLADMKKYTE